MIKYSGMLLVALLAFSGCGGSSSSDNGTSNGNGDETSSNSTGFIISEVLADNKTTNVDPDLGEYSDWVELKNSGSKTLDISGYGLSDSKKKIKWTFPNDTKIDAGSFVLVWADDFNVTANPNPQAFHAPFKLKSNKDSVYLYDPSGNIIESLSLKDYKVSGSDISIAKNSQGEYILSTPPTPESTNGSDAFALSKTPEFSVDEGVYSSPFDVTLTAENGSTIYYTIDGSDVTIDSPSAPSPATISINENKTTLKAISKEPGNDKLISKEKSKTYVIAPSHDVVINEIFADNNSSATEDTKKLDWIELYNRTNQDADISNFRLSDSKKLANSNWKFPVDTMIPANGYLVVFADSLNTTQAPFHTDFKLSDSGDSVVLYNDNDEIIDFKDFGKLKGVSLSRVADNNFTKTQIQTPNAVNSVN
jgi:hypothetical protein